MQKIISALVKARTEFPNLSKNKTNPMFKSKYADLDSVLECVTPALLKHGIFLHQGVEQSTVVSGESIRIINVLVTFLYHESGEFLKTIYPLGEVVDSQKLIETASTGYRGAGKGMINVSSKEDAAGLKRLIDLSNDPQKLLSSVTYARRGAICSALGIAADDDDDGNQAASKPTNQQRTLTHQSSLPFSNPQQAITWAAGLLNIEEIEAAQLMAETPADETGEKGASFHKKVLAMAK